MNSWLQDNGIEMHSTYNERKHFVAERFIRTLRKSNNVYIDKLPEDYRC